MPQGSTSALTVQNFLDGLSTELPDQSLLALRSKAAILFEQAYHLAEKWNPSMSDFSLKRKTHLIYYIASIPFQNDFHTLDTRVDQFKTLALSLDQPPHQSSPYRQRGLLLARTLICCATIQLFARTDPRWDRQDSKILRAALSAADAIDNIDFFRLAYVDPVLGVSISPIHRSRVWH